MALRPEDRYPSPKALADDLERWTADEPVTAWREPFSRRARRWARRNRTLVAASAAAALLVPVAAVTSYAAVRLDRLNGRLIASNKAGSAARGLAETNERAA